MPKTYELTANPKKISKSGNDTDRKATKDDLEIADNVDTLSHSTNPPIYTRSRFNNYDSSYSYNISAEGIGSDISFVSAYISAEGIGSDISAKDTTISTNDVKHVTFNLKETFRELEETYLKTDEIVDKNLSKSKEPFTKARRNAEAKARAESKDEFKNKNITYKTKGVQDAQIKAKELYKHIYTNQEITRSTNTSLDELSKDLDLSTRSSQSRWSSSSERGYDEEFFNNPLTRRSSLELEPEREKDRALAIPNRNPSLDDLQEDGVQRAHAGSLFSERERERERENEIKQNKRWRF